MNQVTIEKKRLREKLMTNRESHVAAYEEAKTGYETTVKEHVTKIVTAADAYPFNGHNVREATRALANLPKPVSHEDDYDRAILMVDWEVSDNVVLEYHEFQQFVEDNWSWKKQFVGTNSMYSQTSI